MNFADTNCCGLKEITGLAAHNHNPKEALLDFCKSQIELKEVKFRSSRSYRTAIYSHYFFTAAEYTHTKGKTYGHQFANLLTELKLGTVIATPSVENTAFHPDHSVLAWFWTPDYEALKAWYKKERPAFVLQDLKDQRQAAITERDRAAIQVNHYKNSGSRYVAFVKEHQAIVDQMTKKLEDLDAQILKTEAEIAANNIEKKAEAA